MTSFAFHMFKTTVKLYKPIYIGQAILDISKHLMYNFWFNHIKKTYGNKAQLLYTDTDSLIYDVETEDIYQDSLLRLVGLISGFTLGCFSYMVWNVMTFLYLKVHCHCALSFLVYWSCIGAMEFTKDNSDENIALKTKAIQAVHVYLADCTRIKMSTVAKFTAFNEVNTTTNNGKQVDKDELTSIVSKSCKLHRVSIWE